jgi:hypothetical protein
MRRSVLAAVVLAAGGAVEPPASGAVKSRSTKTCDGTYLRATFNHVVVPRNAVCKLRRATVGGSISVQRGAYFEAAGTDIAGEVEAHAAQTVYLRDGSSVRRGLATFESRQVFVFDSTIARGSLRVQHTPRSYGRVNVCGTRVSNDLTVLDSGSDILVGDPLAAGCPGNRVGDDVNVSRNRVDVELVVRGNRVGDDLTASSNSGPAQKFVEGNVGGDRLRCTGSDEPFHARANRGWKRRFGLCASRRLRPRSRRSTCR